MLEKIIKKRRSISLFTSEEVSLNLIDELISISVFAPSSCNTQPWFWLIFHSKEAKEKLNLYIKRGYEQTDKDFKNKHKLAGGIYANLLRFFSTYGKFDEAPIYILLFSRPYDAPIFSQAIKFSRNKQIEKIADDSVKTSVAMAMQNFLLLVHERGLGARVKDGIKFIMNSEELKKEFHEEFQIPNDYKLISGLQIGHTNEELSKRKAPNRLGIEKIRRFL